MQYISIIPAKTYLNAALVTRETDISVCRCLPVRNTAIALAGHPLSSSRQCAWLCEELDTEGQQEQYHDPDRRQLEPPGPDVVGPDTRDKQRSDDADNYDQC